MRRVLLALFLLALMAAAVLGIGRIVLVPVAEREAERAMRREFGVPATVRIDPPLRAALLHGALGDVVVTAPSLTRNGLEVQAVRADIQAPRVDVRRLLGGTVRLHFRRIALAGQVTQGALAAYLRARLAAQGPGTLRGLRVRIRPRLASVTIPGRGTLPLRVRLLGPDRLDVEPLGPGPQPGPVTLRSLPYGIHVTGLRLGRGRVLLSGGRGAGVEMLD